MHDLAVAVQLAGTLFEASGVSWALVGGWAVSVHTQPRFTRDVDLAVAVENDAAAERVTASFLKQGFRISALVEQDDRERLATVRLESRHGQGNSLLLDLLYASSGVEEEICRAALSLEILPGLTAPVARPEHLLALKILARDDRHRPQDTMDIHSLLLTLGERQLDCTRHLLSLIESRGFHRQKDLQAELTDAVTRFGKGPS